MKTKRFLISSFILVFLLCGFAIAQTKTPLEQPLTNFDKLVVQLKASSILGNPIQVGETTIIPFGKISFGLGGGGAMMAYGGGMGGKIIPVGILIIEGENVRVELFPEQEKKPSFLQEMLPVILKMLPEMMGGKESGAPKTPALSGGEIGGAKLSTSPQDASLNEIKNLFQAGRYNEANDMADFLLSQEPDNANLHAWKGNILGQMAQGNPLNMMKYGMAAMQEFEKALALDPENVEAHFGRGMGRMRTPPQFGGSIDAIEDFEASCQKKPSAEAYFYLGEAYKKKGLNDKAKTAYEKALKLRPDYPEATKALAEIK